MSKQQTPRALADHQAKAIVSGVKGSVQKAGLVLELIRGKNVETAMANLQFSRKKIAEDARKCLESAIANAENNHDLNVDRLVVEEAYANKNIVLKRFRARARGRAAKILKPRCNMVIIVSEKAEAKKATKKAPAKAAPKAAAKKETKTEEAKA